MKTRYLILGIFIAGLTFNACKEDSFNEKYTNPAGVATTAVDKMMTGVFHAGLDFISPTYWRFFGHDNQGIGALSQNWGMPMEASLYESGYAPHRDEGAWDVYCRTAIQFKNLESIFNNIPEADQTIFRSYYLIAKAFTYQIMLQMLDEVGGAIDGKGGLPWSQIGKLHTTGKVVHPDLDPAPVLYKEIIDELGAINRELENAKNIAAAYDFINDGDIDKWKKYINSMRLRAAIRVSNQGELATLGQAAIKDILETNKDICPVVTNLNDMIQVVNRGDGDFNWSRLEGISDGMTDGNWNAGRSASFPMLRLLGLKVNNSNPNLADVDPRLPLIYDKKKNGDNAYRGVELAPGKTEGATEYAEAVGTTTPPYSWINHRSFIENKNISGYIVTASEIYFYKAEAIKRGIISGDAKAEFMNGVIESVKFYANINAKAQPKGTLPENIEILSPRVNMSIWTDDKLSTYAESLWKDNTDCIYEQLWLHCSINNVVESWNTIRRTGIPKLYYPTVSSQKSPTVPQRLVIPQRELQYNITLRDKGVDADVKIGYQLVPFWAKKVE
ncbi:MAG: SusD/RagB family nutrient-binding outer membrane lipoprotein [Prevotellaceae bacterium]|jgi:hypothetical protein|nr:SusD/RagB family nutrient-binding outer membrane lipoprotein [Prevotellaceae bacterium]